MARLSRREFLQCGGLGVAAVAGLAACAPPTQRQAGAPSEPQTGPELRALGQQLRGRVILPDDPEFARYNWHTNARYATDPVAIALVADSDDTAAAVESAGALGLPFAARSGGHNYAGYSITPGLLISTRAMTRIALDPDSGIATIGAGCRNRDIRAALGRQSRWMIPAGTCPTVGVSGLTMGGGIGPNSRWGGLTADALTRARVVTPDGRTRTASATSDSDLFWALRGGTGGNFGTATEFEFQLKPVPRTSVVTFAFEYTDLGTLVSGVAAFLRILAADDENRVAGLFATNSTSLAPVAGPRLTRPRPSSGAYGIVFGQVLAEESVARDLLRPLLVTSFNESLVQERPWWAAQDYLLGPDQEPDRSYWDRSRFYREHPDAAAVGDLLRILEEFPGSSDEQYGEILFYGWIGGTMNEPPPDATAFVHRSSEGLMRISGVWPPGTGDEPVAPIPGEIREWVERCWETSAAWTSSESFQNFPDPELPDWQDAYFGANLPRLSQVKAMVDPENRYVFPQSIPLP